MKITYIHHSTFLVETESACLLFDWFEGELPPIPEGKRLYVLASHDHEDHFSEEIYSRLEGRPHVTFLLSDDIEPEVIPEGGRERTHFLPPRSLWQDDTLSVETFLSTDLGVAFWCHVDGKILYHAGDLNHWYWEGEEESWNRAMTESYRAEIARMEGRTADVAFLPVDPRLGAWFYLGADDFLKAVEARHIFPMHFWGDFSVCEKLKAHPCSAPWRDRILTITQRNQSFSL